MPPSKIVAVKSPRKLIEVALPLDKINVAAAREKSIRHGHPSTLHLWWARRPLAAARAVLFAQLVNDPGYERHLNRGVNKVEAAKERERLFRIIEDLVVWENTNNEEVLGRARAEIWRSWRETCELNRNHPEAATLFNPEKLPAFHDPFAGGGAIPLEAQRLGLESYASDLNPVAVTINKAMIEIPPRFAGQKPVGPVPKGERDPGLSRTDWPKATGLAEDVRRYGAWMRAEAEKRIGHLYPKVEITTDMVAGLPGHPETRRPDLKPLVGEKLTVVAWLWARTVKSPNPAYAHVDVPLVSTFVLSSKSGKEAYVQPVISGDKYEFTVQTGKPPEGAASGTKAGGRGANFRCILSNAPISGDYIRSEGRAGRIGSVLLAVVAEGRGKRIYLSPERHHEILATSEHPSWQPNIEFFADALGFRIGNYGLRVWADLFSQRQLVALSTCTDLIKEVGALVLRDDAVESETTEKKHQYSNAVRLYLAFAVDKAANYWSSRCAWASPTQKMISTFGRQTLPPVWDYAEANPFSSSSGNLAGGIDQAVKFLLSAPASIPGVSVQADAQTQHISAGKIVSTDPPYYDNIGYADLSDFFYVWLRRSIGDTLPELFSTVATPKMDELVATPARHGGKERAEEFFMSGMSAVAGNIARESHPAFPVTIFYAFKQAEGQDNNGISNTGWGTFLQGMVDAGFCVLGTWPVRTEYVGNLKGALNALASSIVLVCRKREEDAPTISRSQFLRELRQVLPEALTEMTRGGENSPVAPVDLSQAIIGPGMGIFSKYTAVLEADGRPMSVKTALQLINHFLADDEFDPETQFCLQWFEANYWSQGQYGQADVAARAKGTDISLLNRDGLLLSGGGVVELLRWRDLPADWDAPLGNKTPVWGGLHYLIRALNTSGEQAAGALLARMPAISGPVRTLAYRLYTLCERKGLADDARYYNELISAWAAIEMAAQEIGPIETQAELFTA